MEPKAMFSLLMAGVMGIGANAQTPAGKRHLSSKPNVIYILADDLGYGDLSCYGQKKFVTPNIDRLAAEGIRFMNHYSGSTVCAPSRCSLMTGYHSGHAYIRGNGGPSSGLADSCFTVAELFKQAGYVTGAFGKWGLGESRSAGSTKNQGFDEFFGYNNQALAHNYFPSHLWHNDEKIILTGNQGMEKLEYAPLLIHQKVLDFIDHNQDTSFFLYVPTIIPHAELVAPEEYVAPFRGKLLPEKSFEGVDSGPRFRKGPYGSQPECHASFAAMITLLDAQVGEIMRKLKDLGIDNNTIVFFSSDNGPHHEGGGDPDYFDSNGPYKGCKRDLYEGGIHVPLIARWPGKVKPGGTSGHISAFWDMMPTFADILKINPGVETDGISIFPALTGENDQKEHDFLYWEFYEGNGKKALRKGKWKLIKNDMAEDRAPELYDLSTDPGEDHNLALSYPELTQELLKLMDSAHTPSDIYSFRKKH